MTQEELQSVRKQFEYYRMIADETILILSQEQLNWQVNQQSNSVAMLMRHITGNLLSRWTNFFTEDGEKENRNRDEEFVVGKFDRHELITNWDKGWKALFETIESVNEINIQAKVKIRNQELTVPEALSRQLAHYAYHIGQLVFLGKMLMQEKWNCLTIPLQTSNSYNEGSL